MLFLVALRFIKYRSNNLADGLICRPVDKVSKRRTAILALVYAFLATAFGIYKAAQIPEVKKVMIPIQDLQRSWEGARIVQISDIHLGPTVGWTKLNAIVDVINSLRPDIVVVTGDLVDGSMRLLEDAVSPLTRVRSKYGNFFVTGNHEYYTGDVDNWLIKLEYELGFKPLHNSNVKVIPEEGDESDEICVAGTDDIDADLLGYTGHGFNINGALHSCDDTKPVIVLAHQPKAAKALLQSQYRVDLVLAGHTHGGQFFPVLIGVYLVNPFFSGLYQYGRSHVYVSTGTQYWGVPLRLGSSMEITEITLHRATE
ncbi:transmembrane protein with metallophosphoesterase domain-like isoform X2 [Pomacea canaliculata]|uniref:transmembrane protein with metallophosphoesterase domain-like isoform X2 n=1 Tax=Pomacea canaliculata TaxID=400727 RepID=UPI000D726AE2|nr:transmembrane protein with metallophosphoesterase domain-like isoform X2 [Pomacea canaliculata]